MVFQDGESIPMMRDTGGELSILLRARGEKACNNGGLEKVLARGMAKMMKILLLPINNII